MKFGDKYELLESLTTGAVETFAANDKVRGERVLVHILDCAPQKPNQSTMDWVLESFHRVAPEPAGPVLETGKYSGTQYAYLVTKPADDAALKAWVRRYEIQGQDTQETSSARSKQGMDKLAEFVPPPVPPSAPRDPMPAPVSVTQLLRDYDSQNKLPTRPKEPQPLPNLNLGRDNSGLHAAPPWQPVHSPEIPKPDTPKKDETFVGRAETPASPDHRDKSFASSSFPSSTTSKLNSSKPGEFTSFFQGPFRGEPSSDLPPVSSQPIEPPQKKVGDFTAVFGAAGSGADSAPPLEESGNRPSPTSFTGLFKDMQAPPPTFNTSTPLPPPSLSPPLPSEPVVTAPKAKEPPPPAFVAPPQPVMPSIPPVVPVPQPHVAGPSVPVAKPSALPGDGATGAFQNPAASVAAPVLPEAPAGPSPYTQIISRERLMASSAETDEEGATPAAAGGFAAPPMPKMPPVKAPKAPPVKMPPPPPKPKVAAPAMPKAPKVPNVEAPAPPPVSILPVVITFTVLFFVAVLLVMYFWLKNH